MNLKHALTVNFDHPLDNIPFATRNLHSNTATLKDYLVDSIVNGENTQLNFGSNLSLEQVNVIVNSLISGDVHAYGKGKEYDRMMNIYYCLNIMHWNFKHDENKDDCNASYNWSWAPFE